MAITMCGVVNEVTEDYCNLKVSELLKQAGFKEKCGDYLTRRAYVLGAS